MIYYDEQPEELTLEYFKKLMTIMRINKMYTLKYICKNCTKEKYIQFEKGKEAPFEYKKEICEKCECDKFYKATFQ